jgi:glyoxylase-like metal-dependent hydrolase (beta-lactamase superfamily II)
MIKINTIFSGSSGNATYIEADGTGILIDCGRTYKQLVAGLKSNNRTIDDVAYLLITHDHSDHCGALQQIKMKYPLIASGSGHEYFIKSSGTVVSFPVDHDEDYPCTGYVIRDIDGKKYGHITDLNDMPCESLKHLIGCHGLFIEANYDYSMLEANDI